MTLGSLQNIFYFYFIFWKLQPQNSISKLHSKSKLWNNRLVRILSIAVYTDDVRMENRKDLFDKHERRSVRLGTAIYLNRQQISFHTWMEIYLVAISSNLITNCRFISFWVVLVLVTSFSEPALVTKRFSHGATADLSYLHHAKFQNLSVDFL